MRSGFIIGTDELAPRLLTFLIALATVCHAQVLSTGPALERQLTRGQKHSYGITLSAGQFVNVQVVQLCIDVRLTAFDPNGKELISVDNQSGFAGKEQLCIVSQTSGGYHLQVAPVNPEATPGKYSISITELRTARIGDDTRLTAQALTAEAQNLSSSGKPVEAAEKARKALDLWRTLKDEWYQAITDDLVGEALLDAGQPDEALLAFQEGLAIWKKLGDARGEAEVLAGLGDQRAWVGDQNGALAYYQQALPIVEQNGDRASQGAILNDLGLTCEELGQMKEARAYFTRELALGNAVGEDDRATLLENLGLLSFNTGENQRALDELTQALDLIRKVNNLSKTAHVLDLMGFVHARIGDYDKARQLYEEALPLSRQARNSRTEALILLDMGNADEQSGDVRKALALFQQALSLSRTAGRKKLEASSLGSMGEAYRHLGENTRALELYQQALDLDRAQEDKHAEVIELREMAGLYAKTRDVGKAAKLLNEALTLSEETGDLSSEAEGLYARANLERDQHQFAAARADLERALPIVEATRSELSSDEKRASFLATSRDYYDLYEDVLLAQGLPDKAFETNERAKARTLLESLAAGRLDIRAGNAPELVEKERSLEDQIDAEEQLRMNALQSKRSSTNEIEKTLSDLLAQYEDVRAKIRAADPRYADLTEPPPLSLAGIQQRVLDSETVLFEYSLSEPCSHLWIVTANAIRSVELPPASEITSAAKKTYALLNAGVRQEYRIQLDLALQNLSRTLLEPAAAELAHKRRVLIVADGVLDYIPFAALPAPSSTEPMVVSHEMVSLPSASVLAAIRREGMDRDAPQKLMALFSDPVFDPSDPRVRHESRPRAGAKYIPASLTRSASDFGVQTFPRLTFSRTEAASIRSVLPPGETLEALDFNANKSAATAPGIGQYRFLHFATHGLMNSRHPELSGIVLSLVDESGRAQNGFLPAHEIYSLRLSSDMVVLSACETALGKEVRGEGLVGLTRAFLYAGSERVVASLWNVRDEATAELMKRFYAGIFVSKLNPAAALRKAQLSMYRDPRWQHPYYWAAFVMQGEW